MTRYSTYADALAAVGGDASQVWIDGASYYTVPALAVEVAISPAAGADLSALAAATGAAMIGFKRQETGAALTSLDAVLREFVTPAMFYQASDAGDWRQAFQRAAATGKPIRLNGSTYAVSRIVLSVDCEIYGSGTIRKIDGSLGHVIQTTKSLKMSGAITLDANTAGNVETSSTSTSACAIIHSGPVLDLDGITIMPTTSAAIKTSASQRLRLNNLDVRGGWLNVLATVGVDAAVHITGGWYRDAYKDDAIQIHNCQKFVVSSVIASNPARSCIVATNSAGRGSITGCICYGAKRDASNQGGWGICCSVSVHNVTITGNVCFENQTGPISIDTYTSTAYTEAHVSICNNVLDGECAGGYGTTGIALNGARRATVTGNRIRRVKQGTLIVDSYLTKVEGNTFEDCGDGYFATIINGYRTVFANNVCLLSDTAVNSALIVFSNSYLVTAKNNYVWYPGQDRHIFRVNGCQDWSIDGNEIYKYSNGGSVVVVASASPHGRIKRNYVRAFDVNGFSYFINGQGTVPTDIFSADNELNQSFSTLNCETYINAGASIYARGDIINGAIDCYDAVPTGHKFYKGSSALIAGVRKTWDGSAWV